MRTKKVISQKSSRNESLKNKYCVVGACLVHVKLNFSSIKQIYHQQQQQQQLWSTNKINIKDKKSYNAKTLIISNENVQAEECRQKTNQCIEWKTEPNS